MFPHRGDTTRTMSTFTASYRECRARFKSLSYLRRGYSPRTPPWSIFKRTKIRNLKARIRSKLMSTFRTIVRLVMKKVHRPSIKEMNNEAQNKRIESSLPYPNLQMCSIATPGYSLSLPPVKLLLSEFLLLFYKHQSNHWGFGVLGFNWA